MTFLSDISMMLLVCLVVGGVQAFQDLGCDIEGLIGKQQAVLADNEVVAVRLVVFFDVIVNGLTYFL